MSHPPVDFRAVPRTMSASARPVAARRHVLATSLALVAGLLSGGVATAASNWPDRPIRFVVPYAAGQGADILTRLLTAELGKTLSQPVVVENRAGAGGNIGAVAVARAPADGYTFMMGTNAINAANEFLYSNPGFTPADFDPVAMVGLLPMVISTSLPDLQTNDLAQLLERAKAQPDTLNVGLPSTTAHVVFAELVTSAKAPLFAVKYKASAQSMSDTMGGQIPLAIDTVTATRPHLSSGKLRALGITSLNPSAMLPGVKSVAEQGVPGFDVVAWDAIFAPRGTPPEIIADMSRRIEAVLQDPAVRQRMLDVGVEPLVMGPKDLGAFVTDERTKWGTIIQRAGIRIE